MSTLLSDLTLLMSSMTDARPTRFLPRPNSAPVLRAKDDWVTNGASQDDAVLDFHHMRPKQFAREAMKMFNRGDIDIDQLFQMEWHAGGLFMNSPAWDTVENSPLDFVNDFSSNLAFYQQSGRTKNAGFVSGVLDTLRKYQLAS